MTEDAKHYHDKLDAHRHESRLSEVILGGQDGLVNVLGVVLGVAAATDDPRVVLAAGLAATFAESVSMGAVAYTSAHADQSVYESELARERRHIQKVPHLEREEIRALYRSRGLEGDLLDKVVDALTANPDVWVAVMMAEELKLAPMKKGAALRTALVVGSSALVGSFIPLLPFFFLASMPAMWLSVALSGVALFAIGAYKSATTVGHWLRGGAEMTGIGLASAMIGLVIGRLFRAPPG